MAQTNWLVPCLRAHDTSRSTYLGADDYQGLGFAITKDNHSHEARVSHQERTLINAIPGLTWVHGELSFIISLTWLMSTCANLKYLHSKVHRSYIKAVSSSPACNPTHHHLALVNVGWPIVATDPRVGPDSTIQEPLANFKI